jgi:hypothetical protein
MEEKGKWQMEVGKCVDGKEENNNITKRWQEVLGT